VIVVVALLARIPMARAPLDQDGAVYSYVAMRWSKGEVPYRDVWDHKPPLVYLSYRMLFAVLPPALVSVAVSLRVGAALCDALTAVLLFFFVQRWLGSGAGLVAGVLCGLFTAAPDVHYEAFQTEHLVALFVTAGLLAAAVYASSGRYRHVALSGLLLGLALAAKPVAAPAGVVVWAWLTWAAWRAKGRGALRRVVVHSSLLAVGAALPWLLWAGYFALRGAFAEFWSCTYVYNAKYAAAYRKGTFFEGLERLFWTKRYEHGFLWATAAAGLAAALARGRQRNGGLLVAGWVVAAFLGVFLAGQFAYCYYLPTLPPLAAGAAVVLVGLWRLARQPDRPGVQVEVVAAGVLVAVGGWILAEPLGGRLPGRLADFYARFRVAVAGSLVAGCVVALIGLWGLARGRARLAALVAAGASAVVLVGLLRVSALAQRGHYQRVFDPQGTDAVAVRMAQHLASATKPEDRLYVWGSRPQLYVLSGRLSASPYLYNFRYNLPKEGLSFFPQELRQKTMAGLRTYKPPYLVATETESLRDFPELKRYLSEHYEFEDEWPAKPYSLKLYHRKGGTSDDELGQGRAPAFDG